MISDEAAKAILDDMAESERLKGLSDIDLIRECLGSDAFEDLRVVELMNRVLPGRDEMDLEKR